MRKILSLVLVFMCITTTVFSAECYVVMDALSGRVLYSKNENIKRGMASTTKIMTTVTALENNDADGEVTVSANASGVEGSSMYLKAGEKLKLKDLLYGVMLVSGNDAATATAEAVGGSEEKFVEMMNEKAEEMGLKDTHFDNPHGLSSDNHYTTAFELGQIMRYALNSPDFREISSQKSKTVTTSEGEKYLKNHNKLLSTCEGCFSGKTGFTKKDGRCLVSACNRENMELICVTLYDPDDWNTHSTLYNTAFEEYEGVKFVEGGTYLSEIKVKKGEKQTVPVLAEKDIIIPLKEGENTEFELICYIPEKIIAPMKKGDVAGEFYINTNYGKFGPFKAVLGEDAIRRKVTGSTFLDSLERFFSVWIKTFA